MRDSTTRSIFTYKYIQWWLFWQIEFKISFLCRWHFKDKEANYNSCQHLICLFYIWQCSNKTSTPPTRWQVFCTVLISAQNICHWAESKSIRAFWYVLSEDSTHSCLQPYFQVCHSVHTLARLTLCKEIYALSSPHNSLLPYSWITFCKEMLFKEYFFTLKYYKWSISLK